MTENQGERGPHGDHGQQGEQGKEGRRGEIGRTGLPGIQGRQGKQGVLPGGPLRLTDRRILVLYLLVAATLAFGGFRVEANTRSIKQNHYETCRDFSMVIIALNENDRDIELPNCERLRP